MNELYPIFLKVKGSNCLVVGGGDVARRKVNSLLENGASVTVVSRVFDKELITLAESNQGLSLKEKAYEEVDLDNVTLVIAATDDSEVNEQIFKQASKRNLLVNVVDIPELCNFYVPSSVTKGDLKIAISTGGKCPAMAKKIREILEEQFDDSYAKMLCVLSEVRCQLFNKYPDDSKRRGEILNNIVNSDLLEKAKNLSETDLFEVMKKWI